MHYSKKTAEAAKLVEVVFCAKNGKDGFPLSIHSYEVGGYFCGERRCLLGLLHDVCEESLNYREHIGTHFGEDIKRGVLLLTRQVNEDYFDYIKRIRDSGDLDVIEVKRVDLQNNMREDRARFAGCESLGKRYEKALQMLTKGE